MTLLRTLLAFAAVPVLLAAGARAEQAADAAAFGQPALEAALARDLAAHFDLEGDFQVAMNRPWSPERAVGAGWTLSILEYPNIPASSMLVRCQVRDAMGPVETTLLLRAALWRDAWAIRLPITAGSSFDSSRLETRRCDMLREPDLVPAAVGDATYVFARAVPVGRMLTWHDVGRHQQVRKGDLVQATAAEGFLVVSMKVLALESGVRGDTITVRNTDSRKDFSALVTGENHVQVQF